MSPEMQSRWQSILAEAHARYFQHTMDGDLAWLGHARPVTPAAVMQWLSDVEHRLSARFKDQGEYGYFARAYRAEPLITYNIHAIGRWLSEGPRGEARMLDTVLHELGHLFCNRFLSLWDEGHGPNWQQLGLIVGYAPQGNMSERLRDQWSFQVNAQRAMRLAQQHEEAA